MLLCLASNGLDCTHHYRRITLNSLMHQLNVRTHNINHARTYGFHAYTTQRDLFMVA